MSARTTVDTSALAANLEESTQDLCARVERRPLSLLVFLVFGTVTLFAGGGPIAAATHELFRPASPSPRELEEPRSVIPLAGTTGIALESVARQANPQVEQRAPAEVKQPLPAQTAASSPKSAGGERRQRASPEGIAGGERLPPPAQAAATTCGDGKCEPPESVESCFADCPGAMSDPTCGAELHMDPQGFAVIDGRGHHVPTAAACCAACAAHATKSKSKPCNSWVFCYMPHCWSADNGNTHLFGECWLKWQADPLHPLYGQRGKYTDEFRRRNADKHLNGQYPPLTDKHSVEATPHIYIYID